MAILTRTEWALTGQVLWGATANLFVCQTQECVQKKQQYFSYELKDVVIAGIERGVSDVGAQRLERIALSFGSVCVTARDPQDQRLQPRYCWSIY